MSKMGQEFIRTADDRAARLEQDNARLRTAIENLLPILELEATILQRLPDHQQLGRTNWPMIVKDLKYAIDSMST